MRRRFVRHPPRYAGDRPVGLRNNDQFSTTVGILPGNEHGLAAPGMKRIVNPPLLRPAPGYRGCCCPVQPDGGRSWAAACAGPPVLDPGGLGGGMDGAVEL